MNILYSLLRVLLYVAVLLGILTCAIPAFLLGVYLHFMWDCFMAGAASYDSAKRYMVKRKNDESV